MCILGPTPLSIFRLSGIASWLAGVFFLAGWNLVRAGWSLLGWLFFFSWQAGVPFWLAEVSFWLAGVSSWLAGLLPRLLEFLLHLLSEIAG